MKFGSFPELVSELQRTYGEEIANGAILTERTSRGGNDQYLPPLEYMFGMADQYVRTDGSDSFDRTLYLPTREIDTIGFTHIAPAFTNMRALWNLNGKLYLVLAALHPTWVPHDTRTRKRLERQTFGPPVDRPFGSVCGKIVGTSSTGVYNDPNDEDYLPGFPTGPIFCRGAMMRFSPQDIHAAQGLLQRAWGAVGSYSAQTASSTHQPYGVAFAFFPCS